MRGCFDSSSGGEVLPLTAPGPPWWNCCVMNLSNVLHGFAPIFCELHVVACLKLTCAVVLLSNHDYDYCTGEP